MRLRKKISTILAAALLAMALVPTAQARTTMITTPNISLADSAGCAEEVPPFKNRHAGTQYDIPNSGNARGVSALIKVNNVFDNSDNAFHECLASPGFGDDGPSAWVSLEPGPDNPSDGDVNAIVQIGFIKCNGWGVFNPCVWQNENPHFFFARGGCGSDPRPVAEDPQYQYGTGKINGYTNYRFSIRRYVDTTQGHGMGGQYFSLKINGSEVQRVWYDDPKVSCWADADKNVNYYVETWDAGDTVGKFSAIPPSTTGVYFSDIDYYVNSTWYKLNNKLCGTTGPTNNVHPLHCSESNPNNGLGDSIYVWNS